MKDELNRASIATLRPVQTGLIHPSSFRLHPSKKEPSPHGEGEGLPAFREGRLAPPRRLASGSGSCTALHGSSSHCLSTYVERHDE